MSTENNAFIISDSEDSCSVEIPFYAALSFPKRPRSLSDFEVEHDDQKRLKSLSESDHPHDFQDQCSSFNDSDDESEDIAKDIDNPKIFVKRLQKSFYTNKGLKKKSDRVYDTRHQCPFCHGSVTKMIEQSIHQYDFVVICFDVMLTFAFTSKICLLRVNMF